MGEREGSGLDGREGGADVDMIALNFHFLSDPGSCIAVVSCGGVTGGLTA